MSIELNSETVGTLAEIAGKLPRLRGRKIHCSTLWRWASRGIRGVRLEHIKLGGRIVTSLEAVGRFSERLAGLEGSPKPAAPKMDEASMGRQTRHRTAAQRDRDIAAAERELEAEGV